MRQLNQKACYEGQMNMTLYVCDMFEEAAEPSYHSTTYGINNRCALNPFILRTVDTYMHQGNIYFTMRKQIIVTSPAFTL